MNTTLHSSSRVSRSSTLTLRGRIENVFPLFGPVREKLWAEGWNPNIIYGEGEVAQDMVFVTDGADEKFTWVVTRYEPARFFIAYTVFASHRVWTITVACVSSHDVTLATVTYCYTDIDEEGERRNRAAIDAMFFRDLRDWEDALNNYLNRTNLPEPKP